MNLVTIAQVRTHCRAESEDDTLLTVYADAAEQRAQDFLNRRVFATEQALTDAIATIPAKVSAAEAAHSAALEAAQALEGEARCAARAAADMALRRALCEAREIAHGMVVNPAIVGAILLITGHLYRNRESVITGTIATELPEGAIVMLWPHRVGLGI